MSRDFSELRQVPRPEDDENIARKQEAIAMVVRARHADILQLARELRYDPNQPSIFEKVIVFCHGQNDFIWSLVNSGNNDAIAEISQDRLEECIKQMRGLTKRDPADLFKTQELAYDIGIEYRRMWLSLGL